MKIVKDDDNEDNVVKKEVVNKYDRSKRYTWTPEDKFELSGEQFGSVINALRAIAQIFPMELIQMANAGIEQVMMDSVNKDIIKEVIEE